MSCAKNKFKKILYIFKQKNTLKKILTKFKQYVAHLRTKISLEPNASFDLLLKSFPLAISLMSFYLLLSYFYLFLYFKNTFKKITVTLNSFIYHIFKQFKS